jgi:hypothetical protein
MSVSWGVSKLGRIMLLLACIRPNQQKKFASMPWLGNLWLWLVGAVVDVWYNADKRSNLTPSSWILYFISCLHPFFIFFMCAVHCTAHTWWCVWFFPTAAPFSQLDAVFAVCSYEKCSSCELLVPQILRNIRITISKFWTEHYPVNVVSIHHIRWMMSQCRIFLLSVATKQNKILWTFLIGITTCWLLDSTTKVASLMAC